MPRTVLRFYPSNDVHFTALVLSENDVYQVKGPYGNGNHYTSVEAWRQTLPDSPSVDQLIVSVQEKEAPRVAKEKAPRALKPRKIKWNVPKRNDPAFSMPWARHLYRMIKEANPEWLKQDEIRDAYNGVVAILRKYATQVRTRVPYYYNRYYSSINIEEYRRFLHPGPNVPHHEFETILKEILEVYRMLYQMIGSELLAYMDKVLVEMSNKAKVKQYTKMMQRSIKKHQALITQAVYYQQCIEQYQATILSLQSS
jgi:hypothetical protein